MKISLGLLEVKGLALAINTADAMAKCAAITIADIERTNGSGWMLVKITGDVAAVQAAISTGASLAEKSHGLVSKKVLSRPDRKLLASVLPQPKAQAVTPPQAVEADEENVAEPVETSTPDVQMDAEPEAEPKNQPTLKNEPTSNREEKETDTSEQEPPQIATCNLCLDPLCPRHKGEPHGNCVNGGKRND